MFLRVHAVNNGHIPKGLQPGDTTASRGLSRTRLLRSPSTPRIRFGVPRHRPAVKRVLSTDKQNRTISISITNAVKYVSASLLTHSVHIYAFLP